MTSILTIPLLILGQVSLRIAPERTLPLSYADEPLLIEINGVSAGDHEISGSITGPRANVTPFDLGSETFHDDKPLYLALPHGSETTGKHELTLHIEEVEITESYYRLRRPDAIGSGPFHVSFSTWGDHTLENALEIPLSEARISASDSNAAIAVATLSELDVPVHLVAHQSAHPATDSLLEQWVSDFGDQIACWEFELTDNLPELSQLIDSLRRLRPDARTAIRVNSTGILESFLNYSERPFISRIIVTQALSDSNQLHTYRLITEIAGLENIDLVLDDGTEDQEAVWKQVFARLTPLSPVTIDIPQTGLDTPADPERITRYNQWTEIFAQFLPVGPVYIHDRVNAYLFRDKRPGRPWVAALSSKSKTTLELPSEFSRTAHYTDAATPESSVIEVVALGPSPTFLSGTDSTSVSTALCNALVLDAGLLLTVETYATAFDPSIIKSLKFLRSSKPDDGFRDAFFALIRQLPDLERKYHEGDLPAHVVVPVVARLTRIARIICALEQEADNAFLESLENTLTRCNEFLAEHLSKGSTAAKGHRDQQLFDEVKRLMAESAEVNAGGRPIEAAGIAIIAEWRARALLARTG